MKSRTKENSENKPFKLPIFFLGLIT